MKKFYLDVYTKTIESARQEADQRIKKAVQTVFKKAGEEWAQKYPKRKLKLIAGMGTAFWTIDGEILYHDFEAGYCKTSWQMKYGTQANGSLTLKYYTIRKRELFEPLLQAFEWLANVLENHEYESNYLSDMDF